jgi:hypothetical protein
MRACALLPILAVIALGATAPLPAPAPTHAPRYIASLGLPVPTAPGSWSIALDQSGGASPIERKYSVDSTGVTQIAREDWGPTIPPTQSKLDASTLATIATPVERAGIAKWFYDTSLPPSEIHENFNGDRNDIDDDYVSAPHPTPHNYSYELTVARRKADGTIETGQGYWQAGSTTAEPQDALTLANAVAKAFNIFSR